MIVRHATDKHELDNCQMVFISHSMQQELGSILDILRDRAVLTVGDMAGFVQKNGMIGFVLKNGKIHLEINLTAAQQVRLRISANLLEVATIVDLKDTIDAHH
ncbi:hypothetical protein CCP3SC1_110023 [Gammaproteobacteria bacterium]